MVGQEDPQGAPSGAEDKEDGDSPPMSRYSKSFAVGTGVGLFNPIDRALYLSVVEQRPFLSPLNWCSPWEGFREAVVVRTASGGLFFPVFDSWQAWLGGLCQGEHRALLSAVIAGQLTGVTIGLAMNPINAVKYSLWGSEDQTFNTFRSAALQIWRTNGPWAFANGALATALRDAIFGGVYGGGRRLLRTGLCGEHRPSGPEALAMDLAAGSAATALSSPLNYARNLQLADPVPGSPGILRSLRELWKEALLQGRADRRGQLLGTCACLQARMRVGWGTARVGMSMALGQGMYDFFMEKAS